MNYRQMGRTGLRLSSVSIGGWLTFGGTVDERGTRDILCAAVDEGVNFIDLADVYSRGACEAAVGACLGEFRREDLVVSSKVFGRMGDGPNDRGLSRKHIMESVDASLRRLGTDYLDIYFCHRPDPETPLDETARAMDDLVRLGKVHYWGTSVWPGEQLQDAHDLCDRRGLYAPTVEQPQYSLAFRGIEAGSLPVARRLGMGVVTWSPLAGGLLTGKYDEGVPGGSRGAETSWLDDVLNDEMRVKLRAFSAMARELSLAPAQLALAWVLHQEGISSVITGATRPEQVRENVRAAEVELDPTALKRLAELFPA